MELILAVDIKENQVVHGKSGNRANYFPLDWGLASTTELTGYVRELNPKFLYIADLDRIEGTGDHEEIIKSCAKRVKKLYCDRGSRGPDDIIHDPAIIPIFGTETIENGFFSRLSGFLSVDLKEGLVIPSRINPISILTEADNSHLDGCIILDITGVGTGKGVDVTRLTQYRKAYHGTLFYGGGVRDGQDLDILDSCVYDGAIVATAVHTKAIPLDAIQRGTWS